MRIPKKLSCCSARTTLTWISATGQSCVWRTVGNPGVVLKGGKIIGIWKSRTQRENLSVSTTLWEPLSSPEQRELEKQLEGYAIFRGLALQGIARL